MFEHVLLEVYCLWDIKDRPGETLPDYCTSEEKCPSYQCLFRNCPYVAFTSCENALCYIGEKSTADYMICFGGEMETLDIDDYEKKKSKDLKRWKDISERKIKEAYDEYMKDLH